MGRAWRWAGRAALLIALLVGVGTGGTAGASGRADTEADAPLTVVDDVVASADGRLRDLTLHSDALGRDTRVRLLLPSGYDDPAAAATRYPVLLLLHGADGDATSWTIGTAIEEHTAGEDLIVVMPDGGATGFYSDWLDGPAWETHHLDELLPWVEATYRAVGTRGGRAVAGLSMGGFGAMSYAARHPDRFVAAASFSGAVDLTGLGQAEALAVQGVGFAPDALWGPYLTHEASWRSHNPTDLVRNLRGVALRHTTGTGVPCPGDRAEAGALETVVFPMNVSFDLRLTQHAVPHEYLPRVCGTHEWPHWDADLASWLPVLMATFADPPPPPAAFDYRTAEPRAAVWGWSFTAHRPAVELLDLAAVSPSGLTLTGSGPVEVVTPAVFDPGATYTLTTTAAGTLTVPVGLVPALGTLPPGPATTAPVTADEAGRLAFTVDLGPAHVANQWSPEGIVAESLAVGSYLRTATITIAPAAPAPSSPPSATPTSVEPREPARSAPDTLPATGASTALWPAAVALLAAAALHLVSRP